jgi:hypothetical protein
VPPEKQLAPDYNSGLNKTDLKATVADTGETPSGVIGPYHLLQMIGEGGKEVFNDLQAQLAANRPQFYRDLPAGPFYGYNRPGAKASEAVIQNWWQQGMMGGAKAHLRRHCGLFPDRFHGGPQEDHRFGLGYA